MNETPRSGRLHIALFGRRNVGKSSIINAITNQDIAVVSAVKGTTTDPVFKAMELLPIGPVVIIDTAGLDDEGELGELRRKKTLEVLRKTDLALIILDPSSGVTEFDLLISKQVKERKIPVLGILNKTDLLKIDDIAKKKYEESLGIKLIPVSATKKEGILELKEAIIQIAPSGEEPKLLGDLISAGDFVVLVIPIDKAAPKGRLILPQQQAVRDVLDSGAIAIVTKETDLKETLKNLGKRPTLVVTDSQAFGSVSADTPEDIALTSFSILMARQKGDLKELCRGAEIIEKLKDGDKVLIAEACTHHQQCDDIGRFKIPRWLNENTGKKLLLEYTTGTQFPENLKDYSLIIHCGGCMLNRREMMYRISQAQVKEIPIVNYGVLIAYFHGILDRAMSPFSLSVIKGPGNGEG
ncbi:MAG: [FeFe] hydrogenase H-cluster maturation GTPase HydF [Candidatus Riflebacteria bacterium]|nr:[FeFe] hydrogenase H-cluster maturation GTPase HydF [Candidatus Riflebacteria bacterium]